MRPPTDIARALLARTPALGWDQAHAIAEDLFSRSSADDRAREIERWRAGSRAETQRERSRRRARCAERDEDDFERLQRAFGG